MIINATGHEITVWAQGQIIRRYPPSDASIRLPVIKTPMGSIDGVPVCKLVYGDCYDLPAYDSDVYYVVSNVVKANYPNRNDFIVPSDMVYDNNGNILGCESFCY